MAQNKTLELSIKIAGKVDKSLTTAINQTNTLMGSLTTTMSKVGTAGLAAMGALATATAAGLAKCTSEAAKRENNMSAMVRYVDGLTESATTSTEQAQSNLKAMRTYIQDLSTQIPRTTEQISKMSAALGQSGIGADRQMSTGILRDTAVAATAMDLEDDTAGNYMAKWEAAFNFNHDQVMTLMDQINYLGANNATTAAEIAQSVNQAASMGQIAGVDPSATAAIATAMQATGVATDRVGTSISRIYTNISKGSNATKAQKAMWEELGFTAEGIAKSMQSDGIGTLKSVFQAINNMPDERKVAALHTLFGQWAIEGGAKITQNLALLEKTMGEVNDPGLNTGSMERECLLEASAPRAGQYGAGVPDRGEHAGSGRYDGVEREGGADAGHRPGVPPGQEGVRPVDDRLPEPDQEEYAGADDAGELAGQDRKRRRGAAGRRHGAGTALHPEGA